MNIILLKLLAILCIFAGESFSIYAEIVAAKAHQGAAGTFFPIFLKAFGVITVG